ncbi:hypothetical protein AB4Z52_29395 [Rhizobium sp. 2YAF20]|uniref:hypothetical protein n=1 Tax=Rhizobium sp. 2YAF20 TaxID=3233027 RepID=UPI003F9D4AE9
MSMYTSKNPAGVVAMETGAIFAILAAGAVNAGMQTREAMRQAREASNSYQLRSQLDAAIRYSERLMDVAVAQTTEIEQLKAENARLRTASATYLAAARSASKKAA